jgi:hypothetical protein
LESERRVSPITALAGVAPAGADAPPLSSDPATPRESAFRDSRENPVLASVDDRRRLGA